MRNPPHGYSVRQLDARGVRAAATDLAEVLIDCVDGGASVSFMSGLDQTKARRFWSDVAGEAEHDGRVILVAMRDSDGKIVGTAQMIPAPFENQPHRAEIAKMLVLRAHRRKGLGAALMRAAEDAAIRMGKTLLILDTASDDAARLYASLGWTKVGRIPNYALMPDGSPCATSIFFKALESGDGDFASQP